MSRATSSTTTSVSVTTPGLPLPSRRRLLAGSGLAAALATIGLSSPLASASAAPPVTSATSLEHRDAALIIACLAFEAAETALYGLPDGAPDNLHLAALDRYHDAYAAADAIRPVTLAGLQAKARVVKSGLLMMDVDEENEDATEWDVRGAWRLVQDLLALGAVA